MSEVQEHVMPYCEIDERSKKGNREKECLYCGKIFKEIDFPQTFERMVTCGDIDCMGKRRIEMWKARQLKL